MPYATVGAQRLFYARAGHRTTGGLTLVLIHGAGGSRLHWPAALRRLPGASVYAIDLPGHGRSAGPGCDSIAGYVAAVIGLLDATETARAVWVGHSMGGAIAQMAALRHPARVAGLVLIGTSAHLAGATELLASAAYDFENAVEALARRAWADDAPPALVQLSRQAIAQLPPAVLHGDLLACRAFDLRAQLGDIEAPALVIAGTADRLTPHIHSVQLAQGLPHARLVSVPGAGHMIALEHPDLVADAVNDWIKAGHV